MAKVTEYISVKITFTPEEIMKTVVGGSIQLLGKKYNSFNEAIEMYERSGYTVTAKDIDKLSFKAEKEYESDEE